MRAILDSYTLDRPPIDQAIEFAKKIYSLVPDAKRVIGRASADRVDGSSEK